MTTPVSRLSNEQVAQFQREGYLLYNEAVFPPEKFAKLRAHFENKLGALPDDFRPEMMDVPHFSDPTLFEWLFADEVLDLVEPLLGPDIALWSSHFISKPQGDGKRVPWHEDSAYWGKVLSPMDVVTVWLAIDPSTPENGCMYVIPQTQNNGYSDYDDVDAATNVFHKEIKKHQRDESKAVPCILQPNEASLHHAKLMHGSPPNHSNQRRCGYTMRYIPASVKFDPGYVNGQHQIYLARGRDLAGNDYADPNQAYPELARYRETHKTGGH